MALPVLCERDIRMKSKLKQLDIHTSKTIISSNAGELDSNRKFSNLNAKTSTNSVSTRNKIKAKVLDLLFQV